MNHISLDNLDDSVKRFVLSVSSDPGGSILELNGQAVACVVPPPSRNGGATEESWTDEKNGRRVELITKKHTSGLVPAEAVELAALQEQMLQYRRRVAPLPLEDARRLHAELLARAGAAQAPE